jgi:hypothetical protein
MSVVLIKFEGAATTRRLEAFYEEVVKADMYVLTDRTLDYTVSYSCNDETITFRENEMLFSCRKKLIEFLMRHIRQDKLNAI